MTTQSSFVWWGFNIFVVFLVFLDAFVFNPKAKEMTTRRSMVMTSFWVLLALLFNGLIFGWLGSQRALEFFTSYLIEQSLSIDNLFIFLLLFTHFKTPSDQQREILFWGILSAQVMRAVFIISGVALLSKFSWMMYVFGAILVVTGIKMFFKKEEEVHPEDNPIYKVINRYFPLYWVVFTMIQVTDVVFAIDSIPAVLAITKDAFIAYSSNIFAILGLRSMYFALASIMGKLCYLHFGLGSILVFIGVKMLLEHFIQIPIVLTLGFIFFALAITFITSIKACPSKAK